MTNPYFTSTTIDGSPRRPLVEREDAFRPYIKDDGAFLNLIDGGWKWIGLYGAWPGNENGDIALRLTRLAVIEWLQQQHSDWEGDGPHERVYASIASRLKWGDEDSRYNELAHRLLDAMKVEP